MPAFSYYSVIVACLLPPLAIFAVLHLCWYFGTKLFGTKFQRTNNAVLLRAAIMLGSLVLLAIWVLVAAEWSMIAIWLETPAVLGLCGGLISIASFFGRFVANRDYLLDAPPKQRNWLTGLSFSILAITALLSWAQGLSEFDFAPISRTSTHMLMLRQFDLMPVAAFLIMALALSEARRFGDQSGATGVNDSWRAALSAGLISGIIPAIGSAHLSLDDLTWFASERTELLGLTSYQMEPVFRLAQKIWQRDAVGSLTLLSIATLTLFHAKASSQMAAASRRIVGIFFMVLWPLVVVSFVLVYPGIEFVQNPVTNHRLALLIGVISGSALGILTPELIKWLSHWRLAGNCPAVVKLITPPWLIVSVFFLVLLIINMAIPRSSTPGLDCIIETATQFSIFSFAMLWAIRYGTQSSAEDRAIESRQEQLTAA